MLVLCISEALVESYLKESGGTVTMSKGKTTSEVPGWYVEFQAAVLRQLPRPGQLDQEVAEGWNENQKALKKVLQEALIPPIAVASSADNRFSLLKEFAIEVPADYEHGTQLAQFARQHRSEFAYYNEALAKDENFIRASHSLVAGKIYQARIFQIMRPVSSGDCLQFLQPQHALLVGAQGLSLTYHLAKKQFPVGKWIIFLDEENNCWRNSSGCAGVPYLSLDLGEDQRFSLVNFDGDWNDDFCLLCLCDPNSA